MSTKNRLDKLSSEIRLASSRDLNYYLELFQTDVKSTLLEYLTTNKSAIEFDLKFSNRNGLILNYGFITKPGVEYYEVKLNFDFNSGTVFVSVLNKKKEVTLKKGIQMKNIKDDVEYTISLMYGLIDRLKN